eukprot:TRINITY_DN1429_c2_g1_i6.p2 TRINITY_DN1429_c2_g1~~TRINITY_DN1429_c2_g1_i6.p2  ORF type:complete len:168 (+),score=29.37 TRINITY_DN1429_c2_g1_i6:62-565(+)
MADGVPTEKEDSSGWLGIARAVSSATTAIREWSTEAAVVVEMAVAVRRGEGGAAALGIDVGPNGEVLRVHADGGGDCAGLSPGMRVEAVDGKRCQTLDEIAHAVGSASGPHVVLHVRHSSRGRRLLRHRLLGLFCRSGLEMSDVDEALSQTGGDELQAALLLAPAPQ